jgi:hypothetical protein
MYKMRMRAQTQKLVIIYLYFSHQEIGAEERKIILQQLMLLVPDENRLVLQTLLLFLNDVAKNHKINQVALILVF